MLFHKVIWEIKKEVQIPNGDCFKTLNLVYVSGSEMFTFCDVLHVTKHKLSRGRSRNFKSLLL